MSSEEQPPPIFMDISPNARPQELETVCMKCLKQGTTTLLLTKIPFFREVMVSRFECPHCGFTDAGVQFAGEYPAKGVKFTLQVKSAEDLNRTIVKSCHCTITIPEIQFEIPGTTHGDSINTIEGILRNAYKNIKDNITSDTPQQIIDFIDKLEQCADGLVQFTVILNDPSGNSFIENKLAPQKDPQLTAEFYKRTPQQNEEIGLISKPETDSMEMDDGSIERMTSVFATDSPVQYIPTTCPVCSTEGQTKSCTLSIPFFKEIIIMAFNCDSCGYHNGEVMVGGSISEKGRRIILHAENEDDINRECLKSDFAGLKFVELGLELDPGTLGGKFTTVEGLVRDVHEGLVAENPFAKGDSANPEAQAKFNQTLEALEKYASGKEKFTLIMDDPLANSFINPIGESVEKDPRMEIEDYERTFEQNEKLGLNDIHTAEYEEVDTK